MPPPRKPVKPPMREPVTRGMPLEYDLTDVPDMHILAEAIRRGYRPMEKPAPKKGTKK